MSDFEMQINAYAFVKLKDVMSQPHGTAVDAAAPVVSFGPLIIITCLLM
jgi:hypothetical protein